MPDPNEIVDVTTELPADAPADPPAADPPAGEAEADDPAPAAASPPWLDERHRVGYPGDPRE